MFEGDSADTCAGQFPLLSMEVRAEGLACAGLEARTSIIASRNFNLVIPLVVVLVLPPLFITPPWPTRGDFKVFKSFV